MTQVPDSVARGTLINLATRTLGVALVLGITAITARLGTTQQGTFALFTSVESVLAALLSGFGIALARRVSHHGIVRTAIEPGIAGFALDLPEGGRVRSYSAACFSGPGGDQPTTQLRPLALA